MANYSYNDLSKLGKLVGIHGDYNVLMAYFSIFDDDALVNFYRRVKNENNSLEACRYLSIVMELTGKKLNSAVISELLEDKDLLHFLKDSRCTSNSVLDKLREHTHQIVKNKEEKVEPKEEVKETKEEKTYTYHGFEFRLDNGRMVKALFSSSDLKKIRKYAKYREAEEMTSFLLPYGINVESVVATIPYKVTISKKKNDAIRESLAKGVLNATTFDFINQLNPNFAVISQTELMKGLSEERIDEILGQGETEVKDTKKTPNNVSKYRPKKVKDSVCGVVKDLGTQELFIGQPMSIECIFNVYNLGAYLINIPENEFISYDEVKGIITPSKKGRLRMSIHSLETGQTSEINLSVNPSIRHSIHAYVTNKKMILEDKKDSQ